MDRSTIKINGGIPASSDADADTGTTTTKALTPGNFGGSGRQSGSGTTSGYQKLPGGMVFQWERKPGTAATEVVTWPTPFADANYTIVVTVSGAALQAVRASARTASDATFVGWDTSSDAAANTTADVFAIGKLP